MSEPEREPGNDTADNILRIDALCDRFEDELGAGRKPQLEEFLSGEGSDRLALLRELVRLEVEFRRRAGDRPTAAEYATRFPELCTWLQELFPAAVDPLETIPQVDPPTWSAPHPDGPGSADASPKPAAVLIGGKYTLVELIGEGGMGEVHLARQVEPVKREVALKLIKVGLNSKAVLARFDAERQALALMDHPNIARVYDGGATPAGQPYFVMELVRGVPITRYCDDRRLSVASRLELFVQVCQAVQHAHQKGIIHRDLKPGNVLVAEMDGRPTPKVIDFGVAKATEQRLTDLSYADTGMIVGTPAYMSPEQADPSTSDIDTRTDVYALGVMLYELLAGSPPHDAKQFKRGAILEILRMVREVEPPRPSTKLSTADDLPNVAAKRNIEPAKLAKLLQGELDWVVMKALEKDRTRRYDTANGLARDLQRYLADEVVEARPPSRGYRLRKFVRRNKGQVIAATAVVLALIVGTTVSYLNYRDAKEQKGVAEKQTGFAQAKEWEAKDEAEKAKAAAAEADRATEYLVGIFKLADATGRRSTSPRQILDAAENGIPQEFRDQPELRDKLLRRIGAVYDQMTANAPLAMILEARNTVQLHPSRDPARRAVPQTLLYAGDRLSLGADGHIRVVVLSDLHQEWFRAGAEVTVRRKGCEPTAAVAKRDQDPMMTFVPLPKGTFYMGWDGKNKGVKTEIKEDFEIAVHDVTQGQWESVMGTNPSYFSRFGGGRVAVQDISDEELKLFPVESVSWNDCQEFIKKLNEKEKGKGYWYYLPSQEEGEYACRGGATSEEECSYHFYFEKPTNDLSSTQANVDGNYPFGKGEMGPFLQRTTRVGAYPSNKLGLCDMHGNVFQWTSTEYPIAFRDGTREKVYRGGNWKFGGTSYGGPAAFRTHTTPSRRGPELGLRLARVPSAPVSKEVPPDPDGEARAVAAVAKLLGTFERDERRPGRPVIAVYLDGTAETDAGLKDVAKLQNLTFLSLVGSKVTDAGLKELAKLQNLAVLYLNGTQVTGAGLKELASLKNLTSLNLGNTKVADARLKELKELKNLTELELFQTNVTDVGVKELAVLKNLTTLNLGGTQVTDAGLKELKELKNLTKLQLFQTNVTDVGVKELAVLKNLTTLNLGGTQVTDAGLKELAKLQNLTVLYVGGTKTKVTDAGMKELRAALPNCTITR